MSVTSQLFGRFAVQYISKQSFKDYEILKN
jgi:hypothetical protein